MIKNRKVGGTSVEQALASICGDEDVLTRDHVHHSEADELLAQARNETGPYNPLPEMLADPRPTSILRCARDFLKRPKYYNHMRAVSVRARVGSKIWDSYYKFCFERNPWDKTISFYYWVHRSGKERADFENFLLGSHKQTLDQRLPTDWARYTLGDRTIVDDVYDYADLEGGLQEALKRAGVSEALRNKVVLPRLKSSLRKAQEFRYSAQGAAAIERVFANEIRKFGYTMPPELG